MTTPSDPIDRLRAFGNQLTDTHLRLRDELDDLRAALAAGAPAAPTRDLGAHCLAFCAHLHEHHTDEDTTVFPALARRDPALRPVLEQLEWDHRVVAQILTRITELVGGVPPDPAPPALRGVLGELDGLTALLESHFRFEEKRLVDALNAMGDPAHRPDAGR
ncbi:hemerythrin domain-containing protein [Pseudonocardia humida]|uniref:Hemerythrin domain-containing protein n=1 Tax=Pseudonocardia humida TaxID=2800819 RepID=A0ABT0ZWH7_9PSEU|nr:hemerythrin domain-containing protein [Pseudonocardia humida]MCO1655097.1 hemerythrin domain-containing protein [Pseudonocardia humida]